MDDAKQREIDLAWAMHRAEQQKLHPRYRMTAALRDQLCEAQNWRCCYCGTRMDGIGADDNAPSFEHVVPHSLGGPNAPENLVIACRLCNGKRGREITDLHIAAVHAWEGWDA